MTLFPVIIPVPPIPQSLSGKEKVEWIRKASREALRVCTDRAGLKPGKLKKDVKGAPVPFSGTYWSVTHKPKFAGAVIGRYPVGIDIEEIKPRSSVAIFKRVISEEEQSFCEDNKLHYFFRVWTAKEAVLKAEGIGIAGLSKCRVVNVPDGSSMRLDYEGKNYKVVQKYFNGHVASVITNGEPVEWVFPIAAKPQAKNLLTAEARRRGGKEKRKNQNSA